jgi:signal transduction histidine kinase
VAAADLPHVFEPFFTTRRTGTGLGLAIARKVVEALGGTIRMESQEGEGTRVEIDLPATPPAAQGVR